MKAVIVFLIGAVFGYVLAHKPSRPEPEPTISPTRAMWTKYHITTWAGVN